MRPPAPNTVVGTNASVASAWALARSLNLGPSLFAGGVGFSAGAPGCDLALSRAFGASIEPKSARAAADGAPAVFAPGAMAIVTIKATASTTSEQSVPLTSRDVGSLRSLVEAMRPTTLSPSL